MAVARFLKFMSSTPCRAVLAAPTFRAAFCKEVNRYALMLKASTGGKEEMVAFPVIGAAH